MQTIETIPLFRTTTATPLMTVRAAESAPAPGPPATVHTFATFADAWGHWCEIEPTITPGLGRDDCVNAPGLWRDAETGLFMVRGAT
jgi:hypothetical protein